MMKKLFIFLIMICVLSSFVYASNSERFDTNVVGADIKAVLQGIALRAGKSIVINGELEGTVTVHLRQKTLKETLDYLSKIFNFNCSYDGDVITVSPIEIGNVSRTFKIKYAELDYVKSSLALIVSDKQISIDKLDSSVTVSATAQQIQRIEEQLKWIDVPQQQVYLKVRIVQLNRSVSDNLGLSWQHPSYSFGSGAGSTNLKWTVTPNAESIVSKGIIVAEPSVSTINGREAKLSMAQSIPIFSTNVEDGITTTTVTYQDVGIFLNATPRINEDGTITCNIKPTVKAIEQWVQSGTSKAPQISTREAQTIARVQSGKTIVIGGLVQDSDIKNITGVTGFYKLPLLGNLFKTKNNELSQTEVFIFITPEIQDDLKTATDNAEKAIGVKMAEEDEAFKLRNMFKDAELKNPIIEKPKKEEPQHEHQIPEIVPVIAPPNTVPSIIEPETVTEVREPDEVISEKDDSEQEDKVSKKFRLFKWFSKKSSALDTYVEPEQPVVEPDQPVAEDVIFTEDVKTEEEAKQAVGRGDF
jgi:type IV pilus assembly protein PilQ